MTAPTSPHSNDTVSDIGKSCKTQTLSKEQYLVNPPSQEGRQKTRILDAFEASNN